VGTRCSWQRQEALGIARGTIKATVLIETVLGGRLKMDEILYELARALGRAQLRALGLHLQLHQEIP